MRSYTPVSSLGPIPSSRGPVQCDTLQLMVKLYSDGKMSQVLSALNVGESLLIGDPEGDFDWPAVRATRLYLVAAGSGGWGRACTGCVDYDWKGQVIVIRLVWPARPNSWWPLTLVVED